MTVWTHMFGLSRTSRLARGGAVLLAASLGLLFSLLGALRASAAAPTGTVVQTARADVDDGDGLDDVVTIVRTASFRYSVYIRLADGRLLSAPIAQAPGQIRLLKVGNVNRAAGDELFVGGNLEGNQQVQVFTYRGGRLTADRHLLGIGTAGVGEDQAVSCTQRGGQYFVTQRNYHVTSLTNGRWIESDVKYAWRNGALHQYSKRSPHRISGNPMRGLSCGHNPVP